MQTFVGAFMNDAAAMSLALSALCARTKIRQLALAHWARRVYLGAEQRSRCQNPGQRFDLAEKTRMSLA